MTDTMPEPATTRMAHDAARAWLHAYGIMTDRYTAGGGDHPMMSTLPAAFEAYAAAARDAETERQAREIHRLKAENEKLRAELEPFAAMENEIASTIPGWGDDAYLSPGPCQAGIRMRREPFRKAARTATVLIKVG